MNIQKIIFSCSEPPAYSSYWNTQSWLWSLMGIEPICVLFGKKSNTDMHEKYGRVIQRETIDGLPWSFQMTWSKFDFTRTEPETTWIIGDIDLLPLQRAHFKSIGDIPDDQYACLNSSGISSPRLGIPNGFETVGSERHGKDGGFIGADLPAHYHVAKGKLFESLYFQGKPFEQSVREIVESNRYGLGPMNDYPAEKRISEPYWWYWCAEECYTSFHLCNAMRAGTVQFHGRAYNNSLQRIWKWDGNQYVDFDYDMLRSRQIIDIHCCQARPYQLQADALQRVISESGIAN